MEGRVAAAWKVNTKVLPTPGSLCTVMRPFIFSANL